ncbi:MAG: alpha/beta hydrolase [Bacteroidia bacterium]|nr:alpha/beta hydrolase [Bacteroidia bacterium]
MQKSIYLSILWILFPFCLSAQEALAGKWYGKLQSAMGEIVVELELEAKPFAGKLSTSSGIAGMKLEDLKSEEGQFSFRLPAFAATYEGRANKDEIRGHWQQGPQRVELIFGRKEQTTKARPQTPKQEQGYTSEELRFKSLEDNIQMAGTLTLPEGEGPFPAAILLTVAGANDRDQSHSMGHKPFLVLADHLSKSGIAVLRYDDRGVGESEGNLLESDFTDFTEDALAAFAYLAQRKEIDPTKIGYIGNSEGTVIASMAAIEEERVAFTIQLGAVGVPLRDLSKDRLNRMQEMYQLSEKQKAEILAYYKALDEIVNSEMAEKDKAEAIGNIPAENTFDKAGFPHQLFFLPKEKAERSKLYLSPWYKAQASFHPKNILPYLKCPTLIINGSLDLFQHPELNFPSMKVYFEQAENQDASFWIPEGVNHVMQEAKTGLPTEYPMLESSFSPKVMENIRHWIQERF